MPQDKATSKSPAKAPAKARYRRMSMDDIPAIIELEAASFPSIPSDRYWKPEQIAAHVERFPEGQFVAERDGRILGSSTSLAVPIEVALRPHTWREITGHGYLTTHDESGDALYGTEVMVHPDARRTGIGRHLYSLRKDLIRRLNLRAFVTGGRIPGYGKHAEKYTPARYVEAVVRGELSDRTLSAQLNSGLTVAGILPSYITDPNSLNFATLLVWWNLDWVAPRLVAPTAAAPPASVATVSAPKPQAPIVHAKRAAPIPPWASPSKKRELA